MGRTKDWRFDIQRARMNDGPLSAKVAEGYFNDGQQAYLAGKPRSAKPHDDTEAEFQWDEGWASQHESAYGKGV